MVIKWSCASNYLRLVEWLIESRSNLAEVPESLMVLGSRVWSDCPWISSNCTSFMDGWDVLLATVWQASSAPCTRLREHLKHLFAYVEGCAEVKRPQAQLIHDLCLRTRPACCQHLHPNNNTCCSEQFTLIDGDRNLLLSPSSSSYLDVGRSHSHHELSVNIYSVWDSWVFLHWLLCRGGVPPNKEVLICYNLICLKRPVDAFWTFSHITNTNLFREAVRRRCSGPQVREEAGTSTCTPQIWLLLKSVVEWKQIDVLGAVDHMQGPQQVFRKVLTSDFVSTVKVYKWAWIHSWAPKAWTGSGCILVLDWTW